MLDHTKVFGIKNIGSALIFIDRQILSRTFFFYNGIFPTAWMGAGTLIGISSGKIIAEQASARIGNTHCSMDKGFYF